MTAPHPTARRVGALLAAAALATVLAACSGDSGSSSSSSSGGGLTYEDSPLMPYFAVFDTAGEMTIEEQQAQLDAQTKRQEELIVQCMTEQGFEFNGEGSAGFSFIGDPESEDGPMWGTLEYAELNGYDAFTQWDENGEMIVDENDPMADWVDPNEEIRAAMSPAELQAWEEALYGTMDFDFDEDMDMEEFEWNWEDQGCSGWAQEQIQQDDPNMALLSLMEDPEYAELFQELSNLSMSIMDSPAMQELTARWSTCMADAGYNFASPEEAQQSIYDLSNGIWDGHDGTENWQPDPALIQELRQQEIDTAVADFTCRDEIDYDDEQLRAQFELEQAFVDANKDRLEAFRAAAGAMR